MPRFIAMVLLSLVGLGTAIAQTPSIPSSQAAAFMGTWTFAMTNPPNSEQTVRVWDQSGMTMATLQVGKFPPNRMTGIMKDGDVLFLTTTVRENGAPIWVVIALAFDGDTMELAQMMQRSQTIKRGTAPKR